MQLLENIWLWWLWWCSEIHIFFSRSILKNEFFFRVVIKMRKWGRRAKPYFIYWTLHCCSSRDEVISRGFTKKMSTLLMAHYVNNMMRVWKMIRIVRVSTSRPHQNWNAPMVWCGLFSLPTICLSHEYIITKVEPPLILSQREMTTQKNIMSSNIFNR